MPNLTTRCPDPFDPSLRAAEITFASLSAGIVPRSADYDLRDINAIRRLFHDVASRSQIRNPKPVLSVAEGSEIPNPPATLQRIMNQTDSEIRNPKSS